MSSCLTDYTCRDDLTHLSPQNLASITCVLTAKEVSCLSAEVILPKIWLLKKPLHIICLSNLNSKQIIFVKLYLNFCRSLKCLFQILTMPQEKTQTHIRKLFAGSKNFNFKTNLKLTIALECLENLLPMPVGFFQRLAAVNLCFWRSEERMIICIS